MKLLAMMKSVAPLNKIVLPIKVLVIENQMILLAKAYLAHLMIAVKNV